MCQYSSKTEDQYTKAMKLAAKEAFENNMNHQDTMNTIRTAYASNRECSVQEIVCHFLPELNLSRIFAGFYFIIKTLARVKFKYNFLKNNFANNQTIA